MIFFSITFQECTVEIIAKVALIVNFQGSPLYFGIE